MAEMQESGGNMKTMLKLQKRFMEMSEDEIADGMARIKSLDLDENFRDQLEGGLLQRLAEKDPDRALDLMGDAITERENSLSWIQRNAFSKFAKDDPAGAMAWLDQQIKEGKLVSKALDPGENPRLEMESALIGKLAGSDLAVAKARIALFSESERVRHFSNSHEWRRDGEMPAEFLTLARESLIEDQATSAIGGAWAWRANGHTRQGDPQLPAKRVNPRQGGQKVAVGEAHGFRFGRDGHPGRGARNYGSRKRSDVLPSHGKRDTGLLPSGRRD